MFVKTVVKPATVNSGSLGVYAACAVSSSISLSMFSMRLSKLICEAEILFADSSSGVAGLSTTVGIFADAFALQFSRNSFYIGNNLF